MTAGVLLPTFSPLGTLSPAQARAQPSPADAVKALLKKQGKSAAPEPVGTVVDKMAGSTAVRIYTIKGSGPFPLVLYVHGGGWVIATRP